jgi:phage shock protein PspC (stress-responsive transcriptional regulator)
MTIYCSQCGAPQPVSARFCSSCGAVIGASSPFPARRLSRPRFGRQVAGVCLALARANGWDVAVVRIIAVLGLCFSVGFVGIAYIACWIGIPEEPLSLPGEYPQNL